MENYKGLKFSGISTALFGLLWTLTDHSFGPILMAFGIILVTFVIFKDRKQNAKFAIMAATLALMFILEYCWIRVQDTTFYILLLIMSLGTFLIFNFSFKPQNLLTKREKILSWTGSVLFGISFLALLGIALNNLIITLTIGVLVLIAALIGRFMRRRISKDDELKDEFDDEFTTKDPEEYWFRYKIGSGMPRPVRWQGGVCYAIILLSAILVLIFNQNPTTVTVTVVAAIFAAMMIAMLKSNYRESIRESGENLKK